MSTETLHSQFTPLQLKWLEELESGKHKQCQERLRLGDSYCCLGIAAKFVLNAVEIPNGYGYYGSIVYSYGSEDEILTHGQKDALNLYAADGSAKPQYKRDHAPLSLLNDTRMSFVDIAANLRAVPWAYFTNFDEPKV